MLGLSKSMFSSSDQTATPNKCFGVWYETEKFYLKGVPIINRVWLHCIKFPALYKISIKLHIFESEIDKKQDLSELYQYISVFIVVFVVLIP